LIGREVLILRRIAVFSSLPVAEALDPIVGGLVVFGHAETMAAGSIGV
jgi:hypothetical protein